MNSAELELELEVEVEVEVEVEDVEFEFEFHDDEKTLWSYSSPPLDPMVTTSSSAYGKTTSLSGSYVRP